MPIKFSISSICRLGEIFIMVIKALAIGPFIGVVGMINIIYEFFNYRIISYAVQKKFYPTTLKKMIGEIVSERLIPQTQTNPDELEQLYVQKQLFQWQYEHSKLQSISAFVYWLCVRFVMLLILPTSCVIGFFIGPFYVFKQLLLKWKIRLFYGSYADYVMASYSIEE